MDSADRSSGAGGRDAAPKKSKKKATEEDGGAEHGDDNKVGENEKEKRAGKEAAGKEPKGTEAGLENNSSSSPKKISKKNRSGEERGNGNGSEEEEEEKEGKSAENDEKEDSEEGKKRGNGKKRNARNQRKQQSTGETGKSQQVKDLMKTWLAYQAATKDSSDKIRKLESTLAALEVSLDRFGKFCGEYQLIWKLRNFSQCFEAARRGEKLIVYSPTFDTHRSGYKLQLSLCPNGDGRGSGVAMSLFFAILKGPYDSLLQWPFVCPVTMTLLEQVVDSAENQPRDVTMTFMPNPRPDNAPFLGRPEGQKNLSLGFQKFIALTELYEGAYIQDDSLLIKVYVDISSVMAL